MALKIAFILNLLLSVCSLFSLPLMQVLFSLYLKQQSRFSTLYNCKIITLWHYLRIHCYTFFQIFGNCNNVLEHGCPFYSSRSLINTMEDEKALMFGVHLPSLYLSNRYTTVYTQTSLLFYAPQTPFLHYFILTEDSPYFFVHSSSYVHRSCTQPQ